MRAGRPCASCWAAPRSSAPTNSPSRSSSSASVGAVSRAVVLSAVRTPVGRYGGVLAGERPDDLAALVIGEAVARAEIPPAEIEDVYFGAANQSGEDNRNVARMA